MDDPVTLNIRAPPTRFDGRGEPNLVGEGAGEDSGKSHLPDLTAVENKTYQPEKTVVESQPSGQTDF
ncbi:hypothetical protein ACFX15_013405 [Malus domestica]